MLFVHSLMIWVSMWLHHDPEHYHPGDLVPCHSKSTPDPSLTINTSISTREINNSITYPQMPWKEHWLCTLLPWPLWSGTLCTVQKAGIHQGLLYTPMCECCLSEVIRLKAAIVDRAYYFLEWVQWERWLFKANKGSVPITTGWEWPAITGQSGMHCSVWQAGDAELCSCAQCYLE